MIKRPPDSTVWDIGEQRCHISPVEAPETISSKNLRHDGPGLAEHLFWVLTVSIETKAGEVLPLALHHQLLRDHIYRNSNALSHQRGWAARHQGLERIVIRILGDILPHQLIGGDVSLAWDQCEGVDHEATIKASNTLSPQNLEERVKGAGIQWRASLHLQKGADQSRRVDGGPDAHRHEHPERVELPFIEVLPLDDLDVPFLMHPVSCRCPLIRLIPNSKNKNRVVSKQVLLRVEVQGYALVGHQPMKTSGVKIVTFFGFFSRTRGH